MKDWYFIAAYLNSQLPDAPYRFTLKMLAKRLMVDEVKALQIVDEWLQAISKTQEKEAP